LTILLRLAPAVALLQIAACQSVEPPPRSGQVTTIGETTIRTSGSVRMDFVYVN
jgi:hypothetical protein